MCSDIRIYCLFVLLFLTSCAQYRAVENIKEGKTGMRLAMAEEVSDEPENENYVIDSIRSSINDGPLIMKAIKDSETGEMVATDVIRASRVVAKFRNVAERAGFVSISFDVCVPAELSSSQWQLKIFPLMKIQSDTLRLEPIFITGDKYRGRQLRGYERYQNFLASIISDPDAFLRLGQLEVFLQRHFPETYAMKNDTSIVSDPMAENLFGLSQREAFEHYRKNIKWKRNERRKERLDDVYAKYIKDPIPSKGIRLDTVLTASDGDFIYRYTHVFRSRPGLKKVLVSLDGQLYEDGECFTQLPFPDELTFYISSLSSLADKQQRYKMHIRQRRVYDNTKALIDFAQASSAIDTTLGCNASELKRLRTCVEDVYARKEFALDSLVIVASCSPEGSLSLNRRLSAERSESVRRYISDFVPIEWKDSLKASTMPENWNQFMKLIENDTIITPESRRQILVLASKMEGGADVVEEKISRLPEYKYLREKIYPKLRSVSFDFYLHRVDMAQDTVYTTELDTNYMDGIKAIGDMDYKKAVTLLRPYDDYNAALAFVCADYNHSALDVLNRLDDTDPKVCYLKAMVLSRMEQLEKASGFYDLALAYDPHMEHRANLDPEMYAIIQYRQKKEL